MSSIRTAELTPLAMSILGLEIPADASPRRDTGATPGQTVPSSAQPPRPNGTSDRRTSHYNSFQTRCTTSTDSPPTYAVSERSQRLRGTPRHLDNGKEILPQYTCSVLREGAMYMRIEKISPFQYLPKQQWRSVFVVVRGTQLCIHKLKTSHFGSDSLHTAGKLIRKYTLQHAETGLANDVNDHILEPLTRLAHLIPAMARRKAYEKDSGLFRSDKLHALRLRVETDQLLLADRSEEVIFKWTNSICAGIDIAFPIDERCLPKQCTVPRRRRRQRSSTQVIDNLQDQALIAEQERILRQMYPTLARSIEGHTESGNLQRVDTVEESRQSQPNLALTTTATNIMQDQEAEDIDLSAMAEDGAALETFISRPVTSRQTTASTFGAYGVSETPNTTNFDAFGKWAPVHPRSASQQLRYARRCMPILLFDAPRCSSIIICYGRRLHINHRMDMLEEWELQPPAYDAHEFVTSSQNNSTAPLERTTTHVSSVDAASMVQSSSDLDIQAVQATDTNLVAMGGSLEKTKTGREAAIVQQIRPTQQRHGKVEEHSPMESEFPMLIGF